MDKLLRAAHEALIPTVISMACLYPTYPMIISAVAALGFLLYSR